MIIDTITFFKDKPHDFLIDIIPRLKQLTFYHNDIIFNQGDQAEEIFFILRGNVLLYIDVVDFLNMEPFIKQNSVFNMPLAIFNNGSYFGDNDCFLQTNGFRTTTAIC